MAPGVRSVSLRLTARALASSYSSVSVYTLRFLWNLNLPSAPCRINCLSIMGCRNDCAKFSGPTIRLMPHVTAASQQADTE